jgi:hypothetical protein
VARAGPRPRALGAALALTLLCSIAWPVLATASGGDNITATEGVSFTKRVADIDSCVFDSATINWGDGTSSAGQFDTGATPGVKGTHTYAEEGTFNGSVTYKTDCTANGMVTFTATVGDAALGGATGHDVRATVGQSFTGVVSHFTDADPQGAQGDYTAQINWGDGSSSTGAVSVSSSGGFDVTGSHTYQSTGQAAVNVTIHSSTRAHRKGPITNVVWTITDAYAFGQTERYSNGSALIGWGPPGWEHPANYPLNSRTVGTRVHFIRNPTTVTLTVFDGAGKSDSVQHTITYADPVEVWIVKVSWQEAGAGVSTTFLPDYYLAPEHPHYCGGAFAGNRYVSPSLTSAPTALSGSGSVSTGVSCPARADCPATLYVLRAGEVKPGAVSSVHVARRKRRVAPYLGRTSFVVSAGRTRKISVHLKKPARRLARAGRLKKVQLLLLTAGHKPHAVTVRLHRK